MNDKALLVDQVCLDQRSSQAHAALSEQDPFERSCFSPVTASVRSPETVGAASLPVAVSTRTSVALDVCHIVQKRPHPFR